MSDDACIVQLIQIKKCISYPFENGFNFDMDYYEKLSSQII